MSERERPLLFFWHGAEPNLIPEISRHKIDKRLYSPGVYVTNDLQTAQEHTSSDTVVLFGIDPNFRLMNNVHLPLETIYDGLKLLNTERNKHLFTLMHSMAEERFVERDVPLSFVLDELVNSAVLVGEEGEKFCKWLRSHNVDGFLQRVSEQDDHLLIFNPDIIVVQKSFPLETAQQIGSFPTYDAQYKTFLLDLEPANSDTEISDDLPDETEQLKIPHKKKVSL